MSLVVKLLYASIKIVFGLVIFIVVGCSLKNINHHNTSRAEIRFRHHCEQAGEFIHSEVNSVDGIFLMNLRQPGINFGDQFKMDDPYGRDTDGDGYIETFLRESYDLRLMDEFARSTARRALRPFGYAFVVAVDPKDGIRYVYTEHLEEPWQNDKHFMKGYFRLVLDRLDAGNIKPRYGVIFEDISTKEDREFWIAGSSLKVIDLETQQVLGERIGYMFDPEQGSIAGGRSPWLLATRYACPSFGSQKSSSLQLHQTIRFVEKVLHPIKVK